jgi:hypothetical protein
MNFYDFLRLVGRPTKDDGYDAEPAPLPEPPTGEAIDDSAIANFARLQLKLWERSTTTGAGAGG